MDNMKRKLIDPFFTLRRNSIFHLSKVVILLILMGCGPKKENLPVSSDRISAPIQEFEKSTLFFYEGKHKRWKLEADYMRKPLADTGTVLVVPVRIAIYDSNGRPGTHVLADSGTTRAEMQNFLLWGNVYIKTQDSLIIRSERLWWYKNTRKVESDTFVQIETPKGDILRGKGLDATEDFSQSSFKSNVTGQFPDFKQRVEQQDDRTFFDEK